MSAEIAAALGEIAGAEHVSSGRELRPYLSDATEVRGATGHAEAAVRPGDPAEVAAVMAWCYENGIAMTPRGGGTGYAGGAVPAGGVVISLERLRATRSMDPLLWRAEVEAGLSTHTVQRRARENGLLFPPDPGAGEQSQIGGNAATNAGGPHAFKYGVTGAWITGLEAVVPPGRVVQVGGAMRKDVAGYDLRSLLVGSEGTLGIITALHLRFVPTPEAALPVVATYADERAGCDAILAAFGSGVAASALEYLDADAIEILRPSFPGRLPAGARFAVVAEVDGSPAEAEAARSELAEALGEGALSVDEPPGPAEARALWRWREGVGLAADAVFGGKVSEDIAVPVERLAEAIAGTREIARRHGLRSCSWGHAGDGNLHSTFLFSRSDPVARERATEAVGSLFSLAVGLEGTISGEHGVGTSKNGFLRRQWDPAAVDLHRGIKELFDPKGLLNPGKKLA